MLKYLTLFLMFTAFSISNLMCSDPGPEAELSGLTVNGVMMQRDSKNLTNFRFSIDVFPASAKEIKVNYTTKDGTAIGGKDYNAVSGTLTIPSNEVTGYVDVKVTPDSLRQPEQAFFLELSSPVNATISGTGKAFGTILNDGTWLPVNGAGFTAPESYPGLNLVWNEDFSGKTLNSAVWTNETGGGGWGNNELQNYTNNSNNTFLSGGFLIIEARKELSGGRNFSSARIISKDKKTFTWGRMDIRAKLPKSKGIWPALWMLGNNISDIGWPACGELDIMELLGHEPQKVYGTMHWGPQGGSSIHIGGDFSLSSGNFSDSFHVFSLKWDQNQLIFLVDNVPFFTGSKGQVSGNYPFDKPFFFIMNVAVGGNWPGNPDDTTVFPQRMIVDYIKVFQ
jgi:beta-glucanase (GH16 family)